MDLVVIAPCKIPIGQSLQLDDPGTQVRQLPAGKGPATACSMANTVKPSNGRVCIFLNEANIRFAAF